ncbi:4'-phosphopantetheinyl transferase superfamily protein [Streptomyces yangpuensis]|uniref:4'-phosphopantetheinyl transferase superfamily protein n=1 Tax=Streptomyces yangpuensis TaxID=1648182 RepID=A0ABY5PNX2_9ACTN|nr:4'-phosphopantetheinyl transferase superfamily protein [Streptomyces yangpuensis]MBZ9593667.1 4'-phosphopantetheinyl transferase superfamily protein [Streptomyces erythrochromogenes]UUY45742.1 4'-phosphopantetheinyl transferase superfamily protein [Streptomyces yangpuensis]
MIEHLNQLGPNPPVPGPAPTPTTPVVWALNTTITTVGGHAVTDAHHILDTEERERAAHFRDPGHRHRYTTSHLALRTLLGTYLHQPPQTIHLTRENCPCCGAPHGRPNVPGNPLHFSLSHSGDHAYIALATTPVGIDIEQHPTPRTVTDVLHTLHPTETQELTTLPTTRQPSALARCWARKEACLKATGVGLANGLTHPYVGTHPQPPAIPGYHLTDLPAPTHYQAALATLTTTSL